jgi:lipid-binding SYLF domain-containing protein
MVAERYTSALEVVGFVLGGFRGFGVVLVRSSNQHLLWERLH